MEELARRIAEWHSPGGATIHVGRVPDLAGVRIPLPSRTRVVGSIVSGPEASPDLVSVFCDFRGEDPLEASFDAAFGTIAYERAKPLPGTSPLRHAPRKIGPFTLPRFRATRMDQGGFAHTFGSPGLHWTYCHGEKGPYYVVTAHGASPCEAIVTWNSGDSGWTPCAPLPMHVMSRALSAVPALEAPAGVMMQGGGGGGGDAAWTAYGQAYTEIGADLLRDHFAAQLVRFGCIELARGGDASTAWGRWKVPKDDFETIVVVAAVMPEMRLLEQHTFSPARTDHSRQRSMRR